MPFASLVVRVRVRALPEATVFDETETRDCESEKAPGETVNAGRTLVTALPPMVAPIVVADPEVIPVKVAV